MYKTAQDWQNATQKRLVVFGMSGLGKTFLANMLRDTGAWFHYSVDYRIGTRYMGEHIADNAKREAMKVPFLRELLMTDSIYIASNITFDNLAPLSTYLGKPGDEAKGGLAFEEYMRRQELHRSAEISALLDTPHFMDRAEALYGYPHFICDTGGSICEVVDPENPDDPVLTALSARALPLWIKGADAHTDALIARFDRAPKPMYYPPEDMRDMWAAYLAETGDAPNTADPDDFVRYAYRRAITNRQPKYAAMAKWGITIAADDMMRVKTPADLDALIVDALARTP